MKKIIVLLISSMLIFGSAALAKRCNCPDLQCPDGTFVKGKAIHDPVTKTCSCLKPTCFSLHKK
jgi:hypothetical protein